MANSEKQKKKLLYIAQYINEYSDENHTVTTNELVDMLEKHDIPAERKSIYNDISILKEFGMDIAISRGRNGGFTMLSRPFQLAELKLLVDAVQSSRFITGKKSFSLIEKLGSLTSVYERQELNRNVFITNRIKSENESIYYSTDIIYNAIAKNRRIEFLYFNYGPDKRRHYHNEKKPIRVSPFGLQFDSEKYYMIAFDASCEKIKHYRVDKMCNVEITDEERDGEEYFADFDVARYTNAIVKMFAGTPENVTLECDKEYAGAIIDKFGMKLNFIPTSDNKYSVMINAALTPTLYSWIFTFGGKVTVLSPERAVNEYKIQLKASLEAQEKAKTQ